MKASIRDMLRISLPSMLLFLLFLEFVVFRFIFPASDYPYFNFDSKYDILKYDSTVDSRGLFTIGPFAKQRAHYRINNYGWNSEIDYTAEPNKPLIAIIGDSYIEAFQVDPINSISSKLRQLCNGNYAIYSFGFSGAALTQYLQMSRYANRNFKVDILVINVVHNDFDEMLRSVKYSKGFLYMDDSGDHMKELPVEPPAPTAGYRYCKLLCRSNLFRYLYNNCHIGYTYQRFKEMLSFKPAPIYNGNIDVDRTRSLRPKIDDALEYVMNRFKVENPSKRLIFMIDADRQSIYNDNANSNIIWMNHLLRDKCAKFGFEFIDLDDYFRKIYSVDHVHFESPYDWHWNEHGHEAAARALYDTISSKH